MKERGLHVITPETINKHLHTYLPVFEMKDLFKVGQDLEADWIVSGVLSQSDRKLSLDVKVVDVTEERQPFFILMVAEDIDALEDTVKRIAASIDHKISGVGHIDSVRVHGNQRIEKEAILAVIRARDGYSLDYDQLDKDLRDIYKMGFFTDVKIEIEDGPRGKIVVFDVTEKPSIGKIAFEGNKKLRDTQLEEELGIKLYSILDDAEIKHSINRLMEFYRQKGYYNVDIKEKVTPLPNNEVLLVYEVTENKKVYITKIEFLGNTEFDDGDLKDIMETSEKGFFSWLMDSGYLNKKMLEFDVHKITAFYHNHGFIKAKVGVPEIIFEKDKGLTITIEVEEGYQYGINKVSVEGDLIKPVDELLEKIRIGNEKVFSREIMREDILILTGICVDEGYAYAEVSPSTQEDDENHLIDITYNISKGKKVRFERINIIGNTITRDKVIRRELKAIEGEDFSGEMIRRSTENLNRLGFFEGVEVQTKKGSHDDLMVLDVKIKERPTGSFSLGAGYSSQDSMFAMFQIAQNNLFGRAQKLQLSAKLGGLSSEFNISFVEPWLFDTRLSGSVNIYRWKQEYEDYTYDGVEYEDYERDSEGVRLGFGFPIDKIDEFTRGSITYGYDDSNISNIPFDASYAWKDMEGQNVTSSLTFGIRRDSRDKPWNTSKGSVNSLSFEYAGIGGDVCFDKIRITSTWYFPLFWETVFLVRGNWGYIHERSGGKLPVYQKFRIGGMNTIRGFEYASVTPHDPDSGERIGGKKMMYYNFEYRVPLIKEQGIVGLVFFDAGNVYGPGKIYDDTGNIAERDDGSYSFSNMRSSAGFGIRWYSPMGPLRMEYGKNLDPREDEESSKWEFSVGGLF